MSEQKYENQQITEATEYAKQALKFADIVWKHYMLNQQELKGKRAEWLENEKVVKYVNDAFRYDVAETALRREEVVGNEYVERLTGMSSKDRKEKIDSFGFEHAKKGALKSRISTLGNYVGNPDRIPWADCRQELVQAGLLTEKVVEPKKWGKGLNFVKKGPLGTMDAIRGGARPYGSGDEFRDHKEE